MGSKQWGHGYYTGLKEAEKKFKEGTEIKEREREWELALARAGIPYWKNPITFDVFVPMGAGLVPFHPEFYLPTVYVGGKKGLWMVIEGNADKLGKDARDFSWDSSWLVDVIVEFSGQSDAKYDVLEKHFKDVNELQKWEYILDQPAQNPCLLVPDFPGNDNPSGRTQECWSDVGLGISFLSDEGLQLPVAIAKDITGDGTFWVVPRNCAEKHHVLSASLLQGFAE